MRFRTRYVLDMKIPRSIRNLHFAQLEPSERLATQVDELLKSHKPTRWHYESRVKGEESFALKIESGRIENPEALEDFFACTLVVRNRNEVGDAENLARKLFAVVERRPKDDRRTHKSPDSFPFDDLRLYLAWRDDDALPPSGLHGRVFELQIKTYLQHAWSIATHDLIYKTDDVSWSRQRIAYQVRAMLEHAEVSISEADELANADVLQSTNRQTRTLLEIIHALTTLWSAADLPADARRLSENVANLCRLLRIGVGELRKVVEAESKEGRGVHTKNLSPFGVILQSLCAKRWKKLTRASSVRE